MDPFSGLNKRIAAFQYGRSLFPGGAQSAVHPDDLKAKLAAMNIDEINAVRHGMDAAGAIGLALRAGAGPSGRNGPIGR